MKIKRILACAVLVLACAISNAAFLGFNAMSNEQLKNELLQTLRTAVVEFEGEDAFFAEKMCSLALEVEASYHSDPYAWLALTYSWCNDMEGIYPPVVSEPALKYSDLQSRIRCQILRILDYPYHEVSLNNAQATKDGDVAFYDQEMSRRFYEATYAANLQRRRNVSKALSIPLAEDECQVIKLYSSGYIIRTYAHCMAIDLCYKRCFNTTEGIDELADVIDIIFTSHPHDDHYDLTLLAALRQKGVPMFEAPDEVEPGKVEHILAPLADGAVCDITAVQSRQGRCPLVMYRAEIDGWSFLHFSDSSLKDTWAAFETSGCEAPDFVFSPQDTPLALGTVSRMKGASERKCCYFTTHENEYEHSVSRRAAYSWLLTAPHCLGNPDPAAYPGKVVLIDGGESIVFKRN